MKKIMFNDKYGLTQAVLDGRKTMTRRIINNVLGILCACDDRYKTCVKRSSRYQVGEVVAIAQSYGKLYDAADIRHTDLVAEAGWDNKMFVRAKEMPHHIRITNIRVERLQDISDEDCLREGVLRRGEFFGVKNVGGGYNTARGMFEWLIDKVSGKGTWDSNPWVFVYEFELVN